MDKETMLARMDPQLRACYKAMQPYSLEYGTLCAIRAFSLTQLRQSASPFVGREDIRLHVQTIMGGPGNPALELRIYEPIPRQGPMPVILYCHGGGGIMSSAEQDDSFCLDLALQESCVVVSVDYRLAPEHPAPSGQLDCYAAWEWLCTEGAKQFNLDLTRSAFYGGSGGGNMVIGVALRLLDEKGRLPTILLPLYPMIDNRGISLSSREITDNSLWGREQNLMAWNYYLFGQTGAHGRNVDSYVVPIHRDSFYGLPPVFTFVGELDQFRDETLAFVYKLSRSHVPVEFTLYPGCYHGFEVWVPNADVSKRARRAIHEFIQKAFSA